MFRSTLIVFLLLILIISSCASTPDPVSFKGDWSFSGEGKDKKACLSMGKVQELRELLIMSCKKSY